MLAEKLCTAFQIIFYQSRYIAHHQNKNSCLQSDMIKKQEREIELQEELLAVKDLHLQDIPEKNR